MTWFNVHVGLVGASFHSGVVVGTDEICAYTTVCFTAGPGIYGGAGAEFVGGLSTGNHTSDQLGGWSFGAGGDVGFLVSSLGGSIVGNKNGVSGQAGIVGPGLGISIGAKFCYTKVNCKPYCDFSKN
jgi:hypothetical protein